MTFSRDYEGTTLNLLMEDLLETTIIEEMLPEFTELTGITVNFEKVAYPVMREKLVPQLAAGPGNGSYDVLEVDFYWVFEFARSGGWRTSVRASRPRTVRLIWRAIFPRYSTSARRSTTRPITSPCFPIRWD